MSIRINGLQQVENLLEEEFKKLQGSSYALIGIHEAAGHVKGEDMTQAELGAIQHFGEGHIPARPWLDVGAATGLQDYYEIIIEGIQDGLTSNQIMNRIGVEAVGFTQQYITDLRTPPNAPYTIAKKGSDNPLIDTGAMRQSVTYTITDKKPKVGL